MDKLKYYRVIDLIDEDIVKEAEIRAENPTDTESGGITVSGVERYRRIIWHRLAAVASAVLLIAGIGAGGALMLKRRPPLLEENSETTADSTAEAPDIKASGNSMENSSTEVIGENAEVTSAGKAAATETDTKESKNNTTAEKDKKSAVRDHCYPEDSTAAPREENNEPEDRREVTTAANTTQLPVLRTTVTKAQTTTKSAKVTTAIEEVPPPKIVTTEPVTERPTPEHPPGYIPTLTWYPEDGEWIMSTLSGLSYTPWEYDFHVDGRPPEAYIKGSDGNSYELYFTLKMVNRNGRERAPMPDEIYNYFVAQRHECY